MAGVNNNKQVNQVDLNQFKIGTRINQQDSNVKKSIFTKIDKDGDGVIEKGEYEGVVTAKFKGKDGKPVERQMIKLKSLEKGRSLCIDQNGKQWVVAHDGTVLNDKYVENPEQFKANAKYQQQVQTRKAADKHAQNFYQIADDNDGFFGGSVSKMKNYWDKNVNSKNVLQMLDSYQNYLEKEEKSDSSIIDTITSETGASAAEQRVMLTSILQTLCKAAREAGVSEGDINKARKDFNTSMNTELNAHGRRTNPKDMEKAIDFLRGAIIAKQNAGGEISDKQAIKTVAKDFSEQNTKVQKEYKDAREEDGWAASVGDTVCGWFGCTTVEDMDKKLGANAKAAKLLATAKTEEEFKVRYKQVFGIEFDKNKIAARDVALGKYQQANAMNATIKVTNGILANSGSKNYATLRAEIKEKFQINDKVADTIIANYGAVTGKEIKTDADKRAMLMEFLKQTKSSSQSEYQRLTNGKTLDQMSKDLELLNKSAFGTSDIAKDVAQFNENMVVTEMVTEGVFEVAGTIALQFVPGLGQMAAAKLAVSAAKWGTRAVKIANAAAKAEKAFAAVTKFQQGAGMTSKIASKAAKVSSSMATTGVATATVGLTNGDDAKAVMKKTLMNMSFAGVGVGANELAPKLMSAFGVNKAIANELAEEIINAAGSYGITKIAGDDYGSTDAFIDLATGMAIARLGHIKGGAPDVNAPKSANTKPQIDVEAKPQVEVKPQVEAEVQTKPADVSTTKPTTEAPAPKAEVQLSEFESTLKIADLDNSDVQIATLKEFERDFPSTRGVPGRVATLKELQKLVNSPDFAQMNEVQRELAKLAIMKTNPRIDMRGVYDDITPTVEMRSRLNDIDKCVSGDPTNAAGLYKDGDFEVMVAVARAKGVDEVKIKQMTDAYNKAQANGALLVRQSHINENNVPVREIVKDGQTYSAKIIDCTDPETFKNPELYGLDAGTTPENLRLTVHMNDGFNVAPRTDLARVRTGEDVNLSATFTDGNNALYGDQRVGVVLDYDQGAIGYASNYAAGTGFYGDKNFANAKLSLDTPSNATFVRERFIEHLKADGIEITTKDYAVFSKQFQGKKLTSADLQAVAKDGMLDINGKQVPLDKVDKALTKSSDDMMRISYEMRGIQVTNGFNEMNVNHPEIKAIYVRANADESFEDIVSKELLEYAQRRNIPFVFQRKGAQVSVGNASNSKDVHYFSLEGLLGRKKSSTSNSITLNDTQRWNNFDLKSGNKLSVKANEDGSVYCGVIGKTTNRVKLNSGEVRQIGISSDGKYILLERNQQGIYSVKMSETTPTKPLAQPTTIQRSRNTNQSNGIEIVSGRTKIQSNKIGVGRGWTSLSADTDYPVRVRMENGSVVIERDGKFVDLGRMNNNTTRMLPLYHSDGYVLVTKDVNGKCYAEFKYDDGINEVANELAPVNNSKMATTSSKIYSTGHSNSAAMDLVYQKFANNPQIRESLQDLDSRLVLIEDPEIKTYAEDILNKLSKQDNISVDNLEEINALVDASNTFNGYYVTLKHSGGRKTDTFEFNDYIRRTTGLNVDEALADPSISGSVLNSGKKSVKNVLRDSQVSAKTEMLMNYIKFYPKSPVADHLYNSMYLKHLEDSGIDSSIIEGCKKVNNKYGVKISISENNLVKRYSNLIESVDLEFSKWQNASGGTAVFPPVLDFNKAKVDWHQASASGGYYGGSSNHLTGSIEQSIDTKERVELVLRHEMLHSNDISGKIQGLDTWDLFDELCSYKTIIEDGASTTIVDLENSKYVDELRRAGISDDYIRYGYTEPAEFIAVAAQGDFSKYSPEFKQVLINLGTPAWVFNLDGQIPNSKNLQPKSRFPRQI